MKNKSAGRFFIGYVTISYVKRSMRDRSQFDNFAQMI